MTTTKQRRECCSTAQTRSALLRLTDAGALVVVKLVSRPVDENGSATRADGRGIRRRKGHVVLCVEWARDVAV